LAALRRATEFFRSRVGVRGGYVWRYSADLSLREGEKKVGPTTAWVQPPGTPAVGMALIEAFEATRDPYYLDTLRETAHTLCSGQLRSGGWDYAIELAAPDRRKYAYREDPGSEAGTNVTTYDDDTTQAALRMLLRADQVLDGKDERVRDALRFGLEALLKAQYPNGAWPQRYSKYPDPAAHPIARATYPDTWPRIYPMLDYRGYYTFNDRNIDRLIETLLAAHQRDAKPEYLAAVERAGDFMLRAQLPNPQPAWAQQYNATMHPVWARKFEPPAVTGGESQGVIRSLMVVARATGQARFLEPIPQALAYLRKSRLPDGRLARFYELKTNRPLYFTRDYQLTYEDNDLPTHYAFKVSDTTDRIERELQDLKVKGLHPPGEPKPASKPRLTAQLQQSARTAITTLDERGAWVEDGTLKYHGPADPTRRVITTETFIRNTATLTRYLAATA